MQEFLMLLQMLAQLAAIITFSAISWLMIELTEGVRAKRRRFRELWRDRSTDIR